ncbi:MAG: insulinase family protein [Verrucomicrobia bacterium]|jgi:predicted Zn-dependent peptidase|nr:insulinase family protein [Verrucomicrobiota bacterium]
MYQFSRLPGGLTVVTAGMPHMTSVSLGVWVAVGGRYEPAPLCGISHFIEHLLFKGTGRRSAKEISESIEGIGGYLNAFTSEEHTCVYAKARYDRWKDLLEVLVDMFLNSKFDAVEINRERSVIKEEVAMVLDQPQQLVQEMLDELMWPEQPLGRSLTGTHQTLDAIKRKQIVEFQRANYVSPGIVIAAAGNLEHARLLREVKRLAPLFGSGRPPVFEPARNGQTAPQMRLLTKPVEQTQLAVGLRTFSRHDKRRYALRLLNTVLGENMSSRLFQVVREDHGFAYSIGSSLSFLDDTGALTISAGVETRRLAEAIRLISGELKRLTRTLVGKAEMSRARDYMIGQLDLSLEGTESQMMWVSEQMLGYGNLVSSAAIKRRLTKVTAEEIRQVARAVFRPEHLSLALISPLKSVRSCAKAIGL